MHPIETHKYNSKKLLNMNRLITAATIILLMVISSCDREEDDIIPEPTPTSTIITGIVSTADGKPLADIPVSVDFENRSILGSLIQHKAKGKTDQSGHYRLFFEIGDNNLSGTSNYTFTVDLSSISTDDYLIPDERSLRLYMNPIEREGETVKCNITVPRKKFVEVTVSNNGMQPQKGSYAVRNVFPYGSGWEDLTKHYWDEGSEMMLFESIDIMQSGQATVKLPCAVGVPNAVTVVYLGNDEVKYSQGLAVSDTVRIDANDSLTGKITINCR